MPELDRRDFLRLVGASAGAAAAAGCSDPVEKLIPYVVQPEAITPGIAVHYASTCAECSSGCGLHVKTREGRPIKLEGNPDHPINRGKLCARGQASIGRTYHPDRYAGPRSGGEPVDWKEAQQRLADALSATGSKTWILGSSRGPTIDGIIDAFAAGTSATRIIYDPFDNAALRGATRAVFGVAALPIIDVSGADLIVDFGSDFLDTGLSPVEHSAQFADAQDIHKHEHGGARLVSVGPRMSLTGSNADVWIPARAGSELDVIRAVGAAAISQKNGEGGKAVAALSGVSLADAASAAGVEQALLDNLVERLATAHNPIVLPPGVAASTQRATATAAAVLLVNAGLGAVGRTIRVPSVPDAAAASGLAGARQLVEAMNDGQVDVLLIHDVNPLYSLPGDLGFAQALAKVKLVVSFASLMDETSEAATLVLPDHTPLESWGDAAPRAGIRSLQQPTVRPLMKSQALADTLLAVGRLAGAPMPEGDVRSLVEKNWGGGFRRALERGGDFGGSTASAAFRPQLAGLSFDSPELAGSGDMTLVAYPHSYLGDGRGATLPWLQEIPDPVTKIMWRSWAEISKAKAAELGVANGDVVTVDSGSAAIELPVYVRGGVRDDVVAIAIGQGHTVGKYASLAGDGQPGVARGANVAAIIPALEDESGGRAWLATRVSISKTERYLRLPMSQWTDNQHGRGLAQEVSLLALAEGHDDAHHEEHHGMRSYEVKNDASPDSPYRWGMTIDTDRCNGCSACLAACYIENNIPVVGEEQTLRHREMNWIRIERYIGDGNRGNHSEGGESRRPQPDLEELGKVDVRHTPMLCQHCGAAPCESVCPVFATYHTPEGLNGMVYNRCVGTRYCANNCVYKVRRFNYFDYGGYNENFPGLLGMMLNPDVTVRGQGVMEKCTFCIQRIEEARQPAKDAGREIGDGEVVTACQQSCPTNAISFGNARDPQAEVSKKADEPKRAYHSLQTLNARPGITYLAQVKREADGGQHG